MKNTLNFNIDFITEVEKHPPLYDNKHSDYTNRKLTEDIWNKIAEKFDESVNDCRTKWKSLRSAYIRSLNTKYQSGSKREYYLAANMQFLNPFTKNGVFEIEDSIEFEYEFDQPSASDEIPENEVQPKREIHTPPIDFVDLSSHASQNNQFWPENHIREMSGRDKCFADYTSPRKKSENRDGTAKTDPCELFLLSLAPHMASMSQRQQLSFQKGVLKLLEDIKYKQS